MAKFILLREFVEMPLGARIGDEIDVDDRLIEARTRDGSIRPRAQASTERLTRPGDVGASNPPRAQGEPQLASDAAQKAEYDRVNQQRDKQSRR